MRGEEVGSQEVVDYEDTDRGQTSGKTDEQAVPPSHLAVSTKEDHLGIVAKDTLDKIAVDHGTMEPHSLTKKTPPFRTLRPVTRKKRTDEL